MLLWFHSFTETGNQQILFRSYVHHDTTECPPAKHKKMSNKRDTRSQGTWFKKNITKQTLSNMKTKANCCSPWLFDFAFSVFGSIAIRWISQKQNRTKAPNHQTANQTTNNNVPVEWNDAGHDCNEIRLAFHGTMAKVRWNCFLHNFCFKMSILHPAGHISWSSFSLFCQWPTHHSNIWQKHMEKEACKQYFFGKRSKKEIGK